MTHTTSRKGWALLAVSLGQFLIQLDLTAVNVALPAMGADLGMSVPGLQWVVDGYNLALAGLLLVGGRIGDRRGQRRTYLIGLTAFAVGSALCAAAPSGGALIGFRVLQGVGAAIELPATLAILTHTFSDPRERAQAVGIWAGAAGSALVVGPLIGGGLVAGFGWRSVFLVNIPVVAAIAALTLWSVRETVGPPSGRLDIPGQAAGTVALVLLAGGAIEAGHRGFTAVIPLSLLMIGACGVIGFVLIERRQPDPVLPMGLFRNRRFTGANVGGLVMGFVTIGLLFVYALLFQQVHGDSAVVAGLRFVPLTAAFVTVGPLIGRVVDRTGSRLPMTVGAILLACGSLALLRVGGHTAYGLVWWPFVVVGVGYGLLSTPMAAAVLAAVPARQAGLASSANLTARIIGGVFGIAVLGAMLPSEGDADAFVGGLHTAMIVAASVAASGAVLMAVLMRGHSGRLGPGTRATPSTGRRSGRVRPRGDGVVGRDRVSARRLR